MFFEGAQRLRASGAHIPLLRERKESRVAIEAYPALVARRAIGRESYKNDQPPRQTEGQRTARAAVLDAVRSGPLAAAYGLGLEISVGNAGRCIADPTADWLDALLCAVQAGWAWGRRADGYGIPRGADPLEGWIVDPALAGGPS